MKILLTLTALIIMQLTVISAEEKSAANASEPKAQTTCPVMGGKIDKNIFADVNGYRVYVCCNGCISKVKADPDKYIKTIKAAGETPEKAPAAKEVLNKENNKGGK